MRNEINSYFASLIITIVGSGAALLIIHVAYSNTLPLTFIGSEAAYVPLKKSLLKN